MAVKLLVSAESNGGKTTLTKELEDALVISHDGKRYPFEVPHVMVATFQSTEELTDLVTSKIHAYKEKFGSYPKTIVFDSVSKVFDTLYDVCNTKHTGFKIYSELDREINQFTTYIEQSLIASGMNVVILSHAVWDTETGRYNLVGKGSFQKKGGFLAEVDQSIFIEAKNGKRIIHLRSTKFPARTLRTADPDTIKSEDFDLQEYISLLEQDQLKATSFEL